MTDYKETKEMTIESFQDFTEEGFTTSQALAAALEDCAEFMKKAKLTLPVLS